MAESTILFRARVPARRLQRAERILGRLGIKPGDALNMLLAQIEIRNGLPFELRLESKPLLSAEEQAEAWKEALGAY
jgi:addiction module RelB/DinJ family antitoxin